MIKLRYIFSSPSLLLIWLIVPFIIGVNNNQKEWKNNSVIKFDIVSYYAYLPATFIEKDLKLSFINDNNIDSLVNTNKYWPTKAPNGNHVIKTSMGMAILYAPFFFVAHAIAPTAGYKANGFTTPYQLAIQYSGLIYFLIGMLLLRRILRIHFSERITFITLLAVFLGTNLLCYTTLQAAMSHQYNFFLFTAFMYLSIRWLRVQSWKYTILLGLCFGLLILVRPVNILLALFLPLYNIKNLYDLLLRSVTIFSKFGQLIVMILLVVLVFMPQLLYWKYVTGSYFFNSYVGERFYFDHPHLINCLVGFRKGWLIYTPMMIFALAGMYFSVKQKHAYYLVAIVLIPIYLYVISSWWCWWYGGSFGMRAMIDIYPLLALCMAALFEDLLFRKALKSKLTGIFIGVFIALNLFQTIQFHYNVIHYDSMTFKAYIASFGKLNRFEYEREKVLARPDYEAALHGEDKTLPFTGE